MLRTMIGKNPLHFLHLRNQKHIDHKNDHTDQAFHQIHSHGALKPAVKKTADDHRQQEEEGNGQAHTPGNSDTNDRLLEFFSSQLFFQPKIKL